MEQDLNSVPKTINDIAKAMTMRMHMAMDKLHVLYHAMDIGAIQVGRRLETPKRSGEMGRFGKAKQYFCIGKDFETQSPTEFQDELFKRGLIREKIEIKTK